MKIKTAFWLGFRNLKQLARGTERENPLLSAITGVALSIIPLMVVIVVANGMIEGITNRFIEVFTFHLRVSVPDYQEVDQEILDKLRTLPGINHVVQEQKGSALINGRHGKGLGATVKGIDPRGIEGDKKFFKNLVLKSGLFSLDDLPPFLLEEIYTSRVIRRLRNPEERALVESMYSLREDGLYALKENLAPEVKDQAREIFSELKYFPVVLGEALARELKATTGDMVYLLSVKKAGSKRVPKAVRFIVSGVFSTGYQDLDRFLLYIPLEHSQNLLGERDLSYLGIKVDEPFGDLHSLVNEVKKTLRENSFRYNYVYPWYNLNKNRYESYRMTKILLIFIMVLIVVVASVNVSSSIFMLIMGKTREIAILKSMGTSPGMISLIFLLTGAFIGLIGTIAGVLAGLFISVNINTFLIILERVISGGTAFLARVFHFIVPGMDGGEFKILNPEYYLEEIPINISFLEVFGVAVFTVLVAVIASYFPARKAGETKPLEIIRKY